MAAIASTGEGAPPKQKTGWMDNFREFYRRIGYSFAHERRKFLLDHIPKTGGTSLTVAFEQATGQRNCLPHGAVPHHVAISCSISPFVSGHLWFYSGEKLAADWFYATLLRDPLDRFLSQYYFHRQYKTSLPEGADLDDVTFAANQFDLEHYLDHPDSDIRRSYANLQALHFAARVSERPQDLSDAALLDAAVTSLEDYDAVGCYNDIQGFFDRCCVRTGVQPRALPRLNVTSRRLGVADLSRQIRDRLVTANRVDFALIEWARRSSHQACASAFVRLRRALRRTSATAPADFGTRELEIQSVRVQGQRGRAEGIAAGEIVDLQLACRAGICEPDLTVGIAVHNSVGEIVIGSNSKRLNASIAIDETGLFFVAIRFRAVLQPGEYQITLALHRGLTHWDRCFHWRDRCAGFSVKQGEQPAAAPGDAEFSIHKDLRQNWALAG